MPCNKTDNIITIVPTPQPTLRLSELQPGEIFRFNNRLNDANFYMKVDHTGMVVHLNRGVLFTPSDISAVERIPAVTISSV